MADLDIDITVDFDLGSSNPAPPIRRALNHAWQALSPVVDAEISVVVTDDRRIRVLNARHRGLDRPTNVLSFPQGVSTSDLRRPAGRATMPPHLGDIVISLETLRREANERNLVFNNHLTHLVIHGFLHLLGYDHHSSEDAAAMEAYEVRLLNQLSIADPYGGELTGDDADDEQALTQTT